jgi:hypothetical protein
MKENLKQSRKIILPLLLSISVCINLLYFFSILNLKIPLVPSNNQENQNREMFKYIDSPIPRLRDQDSLNRFKFIKPSDSIRIRRNFD